MAGGVQAERDMRFALNQFTVGDLPFGEFLQLAKRCDIQEIEISELKLAAGPDEAAEQMQLIADAGLSVSAVVPRVHALFPDTLNSGIRDLKARLDSFHASIDFFARTLPGVPLLTITGAAPRVNLREGYKYAVNAYRDLAHHAADVGVRVMFEPLGPVLMNTDTFVCTLYRAMELIETVDHVAFGLALDSWHVWDEPDLAKRIVKAGDRIFGVQISDYPRDEPRGFADRLIPGDGRIDFRRFFGAVEAAGFSGPLALEIFSSTEYSDSLWRADADEVVIKGRTAMERFWRERQPAAAST